MTRPPEQDANLLTNEDLQAQLAKLGAKSPTTQSNYIEKEDEGQIEHGITYHPVIKEDWVIFTVFLHAVRSLVYGSFGGVVGFNWSDLWAKTSMGQIKGINRRAVQILEAMEDIVRTGLNKHYNEKQKVKSHKITPTKNSGKLRK